MEKVTQSDPIHAAMKMGYVSAMVDAVRTIKNELGASSGTVRVMEELQRLASEKK